MGTLTLTLDQVLSRDELRAINAREHLETVAMDKRVLPEFDTIIRSLQNAGFSLLTQGEIDASNQLYALSGDVVEALKTAYSVGEDEAVLDLAEAFYEPMVTKISVGAIHLYASKVLRELANGTPIPIINRFAGEFVLLSNLTEPNLARRSEEYLDRMVGAYNARQLGGASYEEIDELTDSLHQTVRTNQLDDLQSNGDWNRFTHAYTIATSALKDQVIEIERESSSPSHATKICIFGQYFGHQFGKAYTPDLVANLCNQFGTANVARLLQPNGFPRTASGVPCERAYTHEIVPLTVSEAFASDDILRGK